MKNLFKLIAVLFFLTATTNIFSQTAYVKWPLTSDQNPDAPVGNIQALQQSIGTGTGSYLLSIFNPYVANGQRLWTGNQGTGWIAGLPDYTRFIQFDASPTSGNDFTVQYISFRYSDNPLSTDFNILKSEVWYSTDGWNNKTQLNTTALNYLNTSVQTFSKSMNVLVQNGQTFSLRIYPYAPNGGSSMTQSWATHKDVLIEGTTSPAVLNNGSICGMKFNDLNGNGIQDLNEAGLPNWIINLAYANAAGSITLIDTTDANGNYCFNNLNPGITYTLSETNQTGWQQTFPSTPGTHTITLTSGQQIDTLNFGNMRLPLLGSICGIKIHDKNGDGIKDSNEDGLPNWTINLFNGTTTISTTTDANGNYCFNDLPAGTYTVSEANQSNWRQIFPPQPGNYTITLTTGQIVNNINFSNVEDFTIELGSICGMKFNDLNGDGIQDLNEAGLPNWIINLSYANAAGSITLMDTTDANGNYCFNNLNPGVTYTLSETNQVGWQQTFPNSLGTHIVVLSSGQQVDSLNFGNKEQPAVGSDCTDFENGNGGWTTNNAGSTIIQEGENHYIQTTDQSGASSFYNESKPLTGNWSEFLNGGCGTLCWDVNYIFAGIGNDGSSQPNTVTPYIAIQGNGFSAYFLTNNLITAGDGWHSYCAPLQLINPGDPLPSNSDGHWVMSVGTSSDWNSMLTNITRLAFSIDPTSYQGEKFGFDNICLNNIGDCGTQTEFCDSLSATAVKTSPDDCSWSLNLNQPANLTGVSSIQILSLAPNQFTTGTGLGTNFQNWFTTGTNTYTSPSGTITGGNLNNFFNVNLSYVTSPQVVVVNWLNESGTAVCTDTLRLNCEIPCATIEIDTVACAGSNYNLSYSFTNNATYSVSNIEYTLQGTGNVLITPLTAQLSPAVLPGANSGLQNIIISGAVSGDIVNILVKYNSPDGCCWCYETISVTIPTCTSVCDSLSVQAQGNPEDCCYSVSLTNNSSTVFSNVEFELISGGMFSTVSTTTSPGWGFTNVFPNNIIKLVKFPLSGGIANGNYSNVLDMCIRQYTSPNQVVAVRWIKDGQVVCTDTLMFECVPPVTKIDSCSQAINGILTCLPDGTYKYDFRVQNNSNIMSTGYGIYPTTPGVTFSQTIFNVSIMPGQVSPVTSIIITGIGSGQNLCFQTAIFTVVQGENAYNYCCHSDTMCVTTPNCEGQTDCIQPPTGMVAWWPLDETSGTTSLDLAGFNNAGTRMNGPLPVAGKVLMGLQFDGANDYIEVPDQSELNFGTGNFSIDAWIQTNENTGQKTILNKLQFPLNQGYSLYLSNGEVRLILAASSPVFYVSSVHVADGNWHHIAVTVDRTDPSGIKFYKDGIMISMADPTTNPGTITAISPLRIGSLSFTVGDLFKGSLDEIELFNRVLTPQEVNSIYSAGSAGKCKPTTDIKESEKIPEKFDMMQCYPNPFNPSTTISYNIPRVSFVKIAVYDILGKEIRVLVNEAKSPGQYEIVFDAKGLSSGIYFYVIRTGEFTQSKKMILMK